MIKDLFKLICKQGRHKDTNDFSDFVYKASSKEKKDLIRKVVLESTKDQQNLIKKHDQLYPKYK